MQKDKAERLSDAIEQALLERIREIYGKALESAIRKNRAFFQKLDKLDEMEARLPAWYTDKMKQEWRQGFVAELMRQKDLIDSLAKDLAKAGGTVSKEINTALQEIYQQNRLFTIDTMSGTKAVRSSFALYDRREISALLQETQSPFSKIAFRNLGNNIPIRRKLQAEMGTAILTGESQEKMVKRIMKVADMTKKQATRVAQTERTRIQSQARNDALQEAKDKGINVTKRWSARMVNTRDSHAALDGTVIKQGEMFHTIWGNELEYPGDPRAPAREVINCHCIIVPDVVLTDKTVAKDDENGIIGKANPVGGDGVRYVCKLNKEIYSCVTPDIVTDEVVITDERIAHIKERHPNDFEKYYAFMRDVIENPDYIIEDDYQNTAFVLKEFQNQDEDTRFRLILRLQTSKDIDGRKNSVITFQHTRKREYDRLIRNKKHIYKNPNL